MTMANMGVMLLLLAAFGLLLAAGGGVTIWWLLRDARRFAQDEALEELRERYASGEIGAEELESRRRDLAA
jgi:uncharacterized membrane protein